MGMKRLLVVDDSAAFAEYVRKATETLGFEVEVSHDGKMAKTAYRAFKPDVIMLDMVMPESIEFVQWLSDEGCEARLIVVTGYSQIDGIEFVQWLSDEGCEARLIVVTGASLTKTLAEARGFEFVKALNKPVRLVELRAALAGE